MRRNVEHLVLSIWSPKNRLDDYIFALAQLGWSEQDITCITQEAFVAPFASASDIPPRFRVKAPAPEGCKNSIVATLSSPGGRRCTIGYASCLDPSPYFAHPVELATFPIEQPNLPRSELTGAADMVLDISAWLELSWALLLTTSSSSPCPGDLARSAKPFISSLYGIYLPSTIQAATGGVAALAREVRKGPHGDFWLFDPQSTAQVLAQIWPVLRSIARSGIQGEGGGKFHQ